MNFLINSRSRSPAVNKEKFKIRNYDNRQIFPSLTFVNSILSGDKINR